MADHLAGDLSLEERALFDAHVESCEECLRDGTWWCGDGSQLRHHRDANEVLPFEQVVVRFQELRQWARRVPGAVVSTIATQPSTGISQSNKHSGSAILRADK